MCNKGNPATTQSGTATTSQSGTSSGQQAGTSSQVLGPTPETLALYQQLLAQAQGVQAAPFDTNTMGQTAPWTDAMNQAVNAQWALGQQGMGFVPQAAGMIAQGGKSTIDQIPGVAASILSPWAGQAVNFGTSQGQAIGDWATGQANNIMSQGPQLQQFSKAAIDQYQSPYTQDVVDATQGWFNNQNAIQGNQLIGQGIKQGNMFGGDRAGVAQGVLAGQQQLAQAPVIAGLYNQGYAQALQEFNAQNQLAAQLQEFGAGLGLQGLTAQGQLGMQGLGLGLNASTAANQQAIGALAQNQNAALQAGQLFGNLGATQFSQNLAGGQQAIGAAGVYPAWLQGLMNQQTANAQQVAGYPFQTTSWYGGLLGGLGPLTGSQQAGSNASISQQQQNQIANQIANQITTPPQPNQFVQAAGLGLAGLGMFLKDGGSVPRMAEGGGVGPYGGQRVPYAKARSYIQDSGMRPGRLKAPDVPGDKPLTLQSLGRALTFMNLGNLGSGTKASAAANAASSGTLGQVGSLLNTQAAKGAGGALSSFFGGNNAGTVNVTGDTADVFNSSLKRGGLVSRYADGGWDDEEAEPYPDDEQQEIPANARYTAGEMPWSDDGDVPLPQRRPREAGPSALDFTSDEPYNVSSPEDLATARTADANALRLDGGLGGQAKGLQEQLTAQSDRTAAADEAPGFGPRQGGLGQGRYLDMPPRPADRKLGLGQILQQLGMGMMQTRGAGFSGLAQGVAGGMHGIQEQQTALDKQNALDRKNQIDNSGMTQLVKFADGQVWDTKLPTPKALRLQQDEGVQRRADAKAAQGVIKKYTDPQTGEEKYFRIFPDGTTKAIVPPADTEAAPVTAQAPGVPGQPLPSKSVPTEGSATTFAPGGDRVSADIPDPKPIGTHSAGAIKMLAEAYLQTGVVGVSVRDKVLRGTVLSYAKDLATSRGMSERQVADMWKYNKKHASWMMGLDGRNAGSMGTVIDHLDTMESLTTALKNGDNQTYNLIRNKYKQWIGESAPTDVRTGAPIVGAEIQKAIGIAGAGTEAERATAGLNIGDLAKSPAQFAGSIQVARRLVGGQLNTKIRQAEGIGLPEERLQALVGKRAWEVLNEVSEAGEKQRLEREKGSAPKTGAPPLTPAAAPTQADRDLAKSNPKFRDKFIKHFGMEP